MSESPQRNSLIVTIPLVVVAIAWLLLVFFPMQKAIGRLQVESREMQQYCEHTSSRLPMLRRTGRDLADTRESVARWNDTTPSRRDLTALLGKITALARAAGLRTTRFDPETIVTHERLARAPLSIEVVGPFSHLFSFLSELESLPQTIWIEHLEIEKGGVNSHNVSCSLKLVIFVDNANNSDQIADSDNR
ncbi:MAG: type 4a pilus biogenesis protein PilO [Pirellulales bacterium]|nr:type 4a pilus biogenesis protein PilO [Pirellulales bacterium]